MKTKLFRPLSCVLGFVAVLCFALAFTFNTQKSSVGATELISSDIKSEYHVGDELVMPSTVTIAVGDNDTVPGSNGVLVFPDGTVHDSASYYFELEGEYQAIYYGTYQGNTVKATKSFKVLKSNWMLSSSKSDMSYMETLPSNKKAGVRVNLAEGDAFVFNSRVNLYDLIEEEGDLFTVISYTPELWREGEDKLACQTVSVKLVDYYNPDNFVEFYQWGPTGAIPYKLSGETYTSTLYAGAGASNQDLAGLEYYGSMTEDRITDKFDGYKGRLHRSNRYETVQAYGAVYQSVSSYVYSPSNAKTAVTSTRSQAVFKFNMKSGQAFAGDTFMNNVKSEYVYPGNIWDGFTTGEVYVQVQCFNYKYGKPVTLDITRILGMSGDELSEGYFVDEVYPVIEFDTDDTDKNGVYIEKGVEFTIPTPTVYDINYEGDLEVAVYYNYGTDNQISVYLKDNKFTPSLYGRYTAVYTATDKFGNETVALYNMNSTNQAQFTFDDNNKLGELVAATENVIPTLNVTGINKEVDTKVYVVDPSGKATDITATMKYEPEYIGQHKIRYVFTDNATTETFEYSVESKEQGKVLFRDGFKISDYLIKDAIYDFDDYSVYKATANGLEAITATIQVSVDNKEYVNISNLNEYKIQGNDTISFKAVYGENAKVVAECKIVDVGYQQDKKDYTAFFYGANSTSIDKNGVYYNFLQDTEVKKVDFINPLMLGTFALNVIIPEGSTYEEYIITLAEYGNRANTISIRYSTIIRGIEKLLKVEYLDSNGELLFGKEVTGKFIGIHKIYIKDGSFITDEGVSYSAPDFDDYRTTVSVTVVSEADCTIGFGKVGNQPLNSNMNRSKEGKPELYYVRIPGDYTLGSTIDVPKAYAMSVLSPILEKDVTVSVTNNEGTEYISNADGEMKDLVASKAYQFELAYLGLFKITYNFSASAGKNVDRADNESFVINCTDSIAPEIQFEEGITERTLITFKAGRTHKLKTFTVSDNETATEELFVRVTIFNEFYTTMAYDVMNAETFNGEYTFEIPGNYIVQVYCQDAAGNYASTFYNICVLEG